MAQTYGTPEYRAYRQANRYGMSVDQMVAMLVAQDYKCAICRIDLTNKKFNVDHDPMCCDNTAKKNACGKCNRGIVCHRCNIIVGHVEWAIHENRLDRMLAYLNYKGD